MNFKKSKAIRVGIRPSPLAQAQYREVLDLLKQKSIPLNFALTTFNTQGDKDKKTSLFKRNSKKQKDDNFKDNFFTDTLDQALISSSIDIAVHSAKDLPKVLPTELEIFALTTVLDDTDSLIAQTPLKKFAVGSKIGTSSFLRVQELKAINPHIKSVSIRGTIQERISLFDQGRVDGLIVATCALKRLQLEHRIVETMPWESSPLQGQLAVVGRKENLFLRKIFKKIDVRQKYGKVLLVGAGPGDPKLITLKGQEALTKADCVFYDYLVDPSLLKFAKRAKKIFVGKRKGKHTLAQKELSLMLKREAMQGKVVVRLKGGDPLIFGRGAEEMEYLRAYHIPVEVIPGISSATGIPSQLGLPLTARGISSSVAFLTAHDDSSKKMEKKILEIPQAETLVFFMGLTKLNLIIKSLQKAKWLKTTPVVIIARGTRPDQQIVLGTLQTIEQQARLANLKPPALIIVGETGRFLSQDSVDLLTG